MGADIITMIETLDRGTLSGLRDRAMLLVGYAGGLHRSEIFGLDVKADQTEDGRGLIEILDKDMLVTLRGKTGRREVEVGRGLSNADCPVVAVETTLKFARIAHRPLFRRVTGQSRSAGCERLNYKEIKRSFNFSAIRCAPVSPRRPTPMSVVFKKRLGHASAEMMRRY